jgi:hypothetical protein
MNLRTHHDGLDALLTELRDILTLLALASLIMANPNTPPLLARVLAVISQHTAMAWADLLTAENSVNGGGE